NQPFIVAGILPPSFDFSTIFTPGVPVDFLMPFPICKETDGWGNTLAVIGRLKPDATIQKARSEFDVLNGQLAKTHPQRNTVSTKITALQQQSSGGFQRSFAGLFCAVGFV